MFEVEKNSTQRGALAPIAHKIMQFNELNDQDKHNLLVDLNVADWEQSKAK